MASHERTRVAPISGALGAEIGGVDPSDFTTHIPSSGKNESPPLPRCRLEPATKPELACRFRWWNGAVAFGTNRCARRYALDDHPRRRPVAHRVMIGGDRPLPYAVRI